MHARGRSRALAAKVSTAEHLGHQIDRNAEIAGTAGLGTGSEQTFLGAGSTQTPGASVKTTEQLGNNIVKVE